MDEFNFYNSENRNYQGGFGDYTDPIPTTGGPVGPEHTPRKKGGAKRAVALVLAYLGKPLIVVALAGSAAALLAGFLI